jgi:hypothetical protein
MIRRHLSTGFTSVACAALVFACSASTTSSGPRALDGDHNKVADDLGKLVDANNDGAADTIDINHDGKQDGPEVDFNGMMCLALDTDCDGIYDSLDCTGDGIADVITAIQPPAKNVPGCNSNPLMTAGSGGAGGSGGMPAGGAGGSGPSMLGSALYQGAGETTDRYAESDIYRNGVGYKFIANGWGSGWQSHDISYNGTSFTVKSLNGSQGADYSPAGYPSMFCGLYSMKQSAGTCGLPAAITSLTQVKTGWRWASNGNNGQYNAAWDIWLGNGTTLSAYLMVWLRDPPGQQPAGAAALAGATVTGLPGTWTIWKGAVDGRPIVNYVTAEGQDRSELEFNVLDVYHDAMTRGYALPGDHILAVAVGYEIWNGPVANIATDDFYVDVH